METPERTAEDWKNEGNAFYGKKEYYKALDAYSKAIALDSSKAPLYSNRAAGYLMVKDYRKALDDCKAAMKIDAKFGKVYPRAAKCLQQLGRFEEAISMIKQAMELGEIGDWDGEIAALRTLQKRASAAMDLISEKNWDGAIHHYMNLLPQCEAFVDGKVRYAQALLRGNRAQKALETVREALVDEPNHDLGNVIRAEALMYIGNPEAASKMVAQILAMDPDNTAAQQLRKKMRAIEAAKERGNEHFKAGRHNEAIEAYTQGLTEAAGIQHYCSVFYSNRAAAYMGLTQYKSAIEDCDKCLEYDSTNAKVLLRRARCHLKSELYEEAVRDFQAAERADPSNRELREETRQAQIALKRSKKKDYYKILGVTQECSEHELKKAYRRLAVQLHPDKVTGSEELKLEAEAKFKDLTEAYAVLSDPQKRRRYDSGVDDDDSGFGGMGGGHDMNDLFRAFYAQQFGRFGGGGGGGSPFGQQFYDDDDDDDGGYGHYGHSHGHGGHGHHHHSHGRGGPGARRGSPFGFQFG
eukprot:TRINITY_DN3613_c0_g1_i1.p1 TRINITY_DN3613_c0_g1~~TRINITY_DN3613_c0_g1_i1.p1  ORF type:complete len:542 (-),score=160.45 TRINITY_DN3613_c0_g1_i1:49-1620(-)